jgi:hypothetical protein
MKDLFKRKPRKIEDDFAPVGTKDCEMKCERRVIMMSNGSVVVCEGCKRIVMDNRESDEGGNSDNSN